MTNVGEVQTTCGDTGFCESVSLAHGQEEEGRGRVVEGFQGRRQMAREGVKVKKIGRKGFRRKGFLSSHG